MCRKPPFTVQVGPILVNDIGVVVNETAERRHDDHGDCQDPPRRAGKPGRDPLQPYQQRRGHAPAPERVGEYGKDRCARRPVRMEPRGVAGEGALTVHVGERYRRG